MSYSNGYSNQYHIHRSPDETLAQYTYGLFSFKTLTALTSGKSSKTCQEIL